MFEENNVHVIVRALKQHLALQGKTIASAARIGEGGQRVGNVGAFGRVSGARASAPASGRYVAARTRRVGARARARTSKSTILSRLAARRVPFRASK